MLELQILPISHGKKLQILSISRQKNYEFRQSGTKKSLNFITHSQEKIIGHGKKLQFCRYGATKSLILLICHMKKSQNSSINRGVESLKFSQ